MRRLLWLFGCCAIAAVVAAGSGYTQDKKDDKKDDKSVAKGTLPQGWGKIGLTADQKKKITALRGTYADKISELTKQIDQLKAERDAECVKLLTNDQKAELKKIATDKIEGKDKDKSERTPEEPKDNQSAEVRLPDVVVFRRQDD